jgi:MoaA/NifB/PqqE/SkfB family radical SAM enzyme
MSKHLKFIRNAVWPDGSLTSINPYKVNFIVTKECHSKCLNCNIWKVIPQGELTLSEFQLIAQRNPQLSWLNFSGGEPTDRKDFPEIIQNFVENCPDLLLVHFPTNGINVKRIISQTKRILDLAAPSRFMVTVSIDGPPAIHNRLRGVPGNFDLALETLKRLFDLKKVKPYVGMTLYEDNHHLISETVAAIREKIPGFSYSRFHVNLPNQSEHYYENASAASKPTQAMISSLAKYRHDRGLITSPVDWIENSYATYATQYLETGKTPVDCAALTSSCFINEKGTVFPCSIWNKPLGNLRDYDFNLKTLLNNDVGFEAKQDVHQKKCPNCWTPCEAIQSMLCKIA